jgi:hypothetical protein
MKRVLDAVEIAHEVGELLWSVSTNTMRLVQKELPIPQGRFRILVDRDDDGLNVSVAPTFARRPVSNLSQGFSHGGLFAFSSYHLRGSVTMNDHPTSCPSQARVLS